VKSCQGEKFCGGTLIYNALEFNTSEIRRIDISGFDSWRVETFVPKVASCDKEYRGLRDLGTSGVGIQRRQRLEEKSHEVPKLGMRDT